MLRDELAWTGPELCDSLVLYEDTPTRDLALRLCGALSEKFKPGLEFQFHWFGFKYLYVPEIAHQAAQAALDSNLIFVSTHRMETLPFEVIAWLELWLPKRTYDDGALVVLQNSSDSRTSVPWQEAYLHSLAQRARLDYLPDSVPRPAEGFLDRLREDKVVPDAFPAIQASTHQYHSSGWGINE